MTLQVFTLLDVQV